MVTYLGSNIPLEIYIWRNRITGFLKKNKKKTKKVFVESGTRTHISPSPGMHSVFDPVEPPRLDNKLEILIMKFVVMLTCVN